jgi:O-antigen/teichoic acid export membrane protein
VGTPVAGALSPALQAERSLLRGAYSLVANTAVTSLLGMAFWVAAARLYTSSAVGRDAALLSAMIELSTICQLNLGNGIVRFLPDLGPESRRAVSLAYLLCCAVALAVGAAFVLEAPRASHGLAFLGADRGLQIGFLATLVLWGIFTLQDAVLTATRRAPWIPLENGAFGVLKLAALPLLLASGLSHGVFFAWVLPMALLLVPVSYLVFARAIPQHVNASLNRESSVSRLGRKKALRFITQDYLASIFTQATLTLLPLLVIAMLGAKASAYFAIPFMIVMAFDTLAYSACTSLVVEATLAEERLASLSRSMLRRVLALLLPAGALLIVAAPLVLMPFGEAYEKHGASVLRLLVCASLFRGGIALFAAISRVQGRGLRLGAIELALLVLVIGPGALLADSAGITGVATAWLGANALIFAVLTPWLVSFLRERNRPRGGLV